MLDAEKITYFRYWYTIFSLRHWYERVVLNSMRLSVCIRTIGLE